MKKTKSFSLIEILVASTIFSGVVLVILATVSMLSNVEMGIKSARTVNSATSFVVESLSRDIAEADKKFNVGAEQYNGFILSNSRPDDINVTAGGGAQGYYQELTINSSIVSTAGNLSDFPILFDSKIDTTLKDNLTNQTQLSIYFTDTNDSLLPYEIEKFDSNGSMGNAGELVAWIKINLPQHNKIRIHYGDSSVTIDRQNVAGVWTNNYKSVWHFKESSGTIPSQVKDSSSSGINGTNHGVSIANGGALGNYGLFDGNQYVDLGSPANLPYGNSSRTLCGWVYSKQEFIDSMSYGWAVAYGSPYGNNASFLGRAGYNYYGPGGYGNDLISADHYDAGAMVYSCMTYDQATQTAKQYYNGEFDVEGVYSWNTLKSVAYIGQQVNNWGECWIGRLDEITIAGTIRTPEWIKTQYENQSNITNFYSSVGTKTPFSSGGLPAGCSGGFCDDFANWQNGILLHAGGQYKFYYYDNAAIYLRVLDSNDDFSVDIFNQLKTLGKDSKITPDNVEIQKFGLISSCRSNLSPWAKILIEAKSKNFLKNRTEIFTSETMANTRNRTW